MKFYFRSLQISAVWSLLLLFNQGCSSFLHNYPQKRTQSTAWLKDVNDSDGSTNGTTTNTSENKAMSFLKKIGKVGGAANKDFALAVGIDEGGGKSSASGSVRIEFDVSLFMHLIDSRVSFS